MSHAENPKIIDMDANGREDIAHDPPLETVADLKLQKGREK